MSHTITIVGLGPGSLDDLTLGAVRSLQNATHLILRTERHPVVAELRPLLAAGCTISTCDDLYTVHAAFADVYQAIVERVLAAARTPAPDSVSHNIVYAVPGHPWVGEATTPAIVASGAQQGIAVKVIGGLSFVAPTFAAAGVDLMDGSQVCDAMLLAAQHYPQVETTLPLLVAQVYARWLASDLKLTLLAAYPQGHQVLLIRGAGTEGQSVEQLALGNLDHHDRFDHLTSVYVPPLGPHSSLTSLLELVAHLRAPEGCPWDREQTLASLRQDLAGETAEVIEAIDLEQGSVPDNSLHIAEELGDLFLVTSMLAQIAAEEGRFQMADIMQGVITKLIRRHPHVFSSEAVEGVDHVLRNWDAIKAQERAERGEVAHPLDGIPASLPALEKARKLQSKAAKQGLLDRAALAGATPELAELLGPSPSEEEFGALLWQIVALAHQFDLNPEDALRAYVVRFRQAAGDGAIQP
jgi:tetrapyrrole methylase family protein/MazG family protein